MIISRAAAVVSAFILAVLCQCSAVFAAEPGVVTNTKTQAHKELFDIPILMTPAKGLNLAKSRSQARRLIEQQGVKIDGETVTDGNLVVDRPCILQCGKRHYLRIKR